MVAAAAHGGTGRVKQASPVRRIDGTERTDSPSPLSPALDESGAPAKAIPSYALVSALSQAFSYPAHGIDDTIGALRALDDADCGRHAESVADVCAAADELSDDIRTQLAYTRLFIGSFKMEAPPYASYYLDGAREVEGPTTAKVRAVYRQFGLELDADEHAPADHLRYLLAFEAQLARRFEETAHPAFAEAFCDFANDYLRSWLPAFSELVSAHAEQSFYCLLARLVADVFA
jgi:TorA maturation chaperone TorD